MSPLKTFKFSRPTKARWLYVEQLPLVSFLKRVDEKEMSVLSESNVLRRRGGVKRPRKKKNTAQVVVFISGPVLLLFFNFFFL